MDDRTDAAALAGGPRLTQFPSLVETTVEQAYGELQKLAKSFPAQRDDDR